MKRRKISADGKSPITEATYSPDNNVTSSRRQFLKKAGKVALIGGAVGGNIAVIVASNKAGYERREQEIIQPKKHTVTEEEAAMPRRDALLSIFFEAYHPNYLATVDGPDEAAIITYMENGGVINRTAVEQERQTDDLEAGDELELPPPINSKG